MDHQVRPEHLDEITSLNVDDLQVEELERRLEMALATPIGLEGQGPAYDDYTCGTFNCPNNTACGTLTSCSNYTCGRLGAEQVELMM